MQNINTENDKNSEPKMTKPLPLPSQLIKEGEEPKPNWTSLDNYKPEYNKEVEVCYLQDTNIKWLTTGRLRNDNRWIIKQNLQRQISLNNSVPTHWRELK